MNNGKVHLEHLTLLHEEVEHRASNGPPDSKEWARSHIEAWLLGTSIYAVCFTRMIQALALYADAHNTRYGSPIGEDDVLGGAWADATYAVRGLLDGELGGLDGGTLDRMLVGMLRREGFEK
jgi:hypothetical protein